MDKYSEVITNYLGSTDKNLCDDCLSKLLSIEPRQTINAVCNKLFKQDMINRCKGECSYCKKIKIVNGVGHTYNNEVVNHEVNSQNHCPNLQNTNNNGVFSRLPFDEFENRVGLYLNKKFKDSFYETPLLFVFCRFER